MKEVVNIVNFVPVIQEVPDDWIRCSVSGEFRPREEFCNERGVQRRTNCYRTYSLPFEDMQKEEEKFKEVKNSEAYNALLDQLNLEWNYKNSSVSVEEMIKALQELPEGSRVYVGQDGYYADGKFAEVFMPDFDVEVKNVKYFKIGHSSQNY